MRQKKQHERAPKRDVNRPGDHFAIMMSPL
jgi:hypothetical protein